jgi:hypothetical protein
MSRAGQLLACVALLGCGCSDGNSPADAGADLAAPEPDLSRAPPQPEITNHGGPVLDTPEVWTVVWSGEEARGAAINDFVQWMLTSDYFTKGMSEYGVHAGHAAGEIVLSGAPPGELLGAADPFASLIDGILSQPGRTANANTLFVFVLPASLKPTIGGAPACQTAEGFHTETANGHVYAVTYSCGSAITHVISHEVVESCSDPKPNTQPAWVADALQPVGEIGDLCFTLNASYPPPISDGGTEFAIYDVNRIWSAEVAMTGLADPCQPAPADKPWFGVAAIPLSVDVNTDTSGAGSTSAVIEPFAFGPVGNIGWAVIPPPTGMTIDPAQGVGKPGDMIPITVSVSAGSRFPNPVPVFIQSRDSPGTVGLSIMVINVN